MSATARDDEENTQRHCRFFLSSLLTLSLTIHGLMVSVVVIKQSMVMDGHVAALPYRPHASLA